MKTDLVTSAHLALAALALAAATAAAAPATGIHWGPERALGAGTARAWVSVDVDGAPSAMGVSITPRALRVDARRGAAPEAVLPLPPDVEVPALASGAATPAWARTAFRVRWDRATRTYVVSLDGLGGGAAPVAAR